MAAPRKTAPPSPEQKVIVQHRPDTRVRITIELPSSLTDLYEEQAIAKGRNLEDEIIDRLNRCKTYTALNPLYINDELRQRLERGLEHHFQSPEQAIAQILTAMSIQVGDVGVEISATLARRISTRVFRGETYEQVVKRETIIGLEKFAGMRPA